MDLREEKPETTSTVTVVLLLTAWSSANSVEKKTALVRKCGQEYFYLLMVVVCRASLTAVSGRA